MRDTPSHARDHLCPIWKESIQNCTSYRADTECGTDRESETNTPAQQLCCAGGITIHWQNQNTSTKLNCHLKKMWNIWLHSFNKQLCCVIVCTSYCWAYKDKVVKNISSWLWHLFEHTEVNAVNCMNTKYNLTSGKTFTKIVVTHISF